MEILSTLWGKIAGLAFLIVSLLGAIFLYGKQERKQAREDLRRDDREEISKAERSKYEIEKSNRSEPLESLRDKLRKFRN